MVEVIKKYLFFPVASYFKFFASIKLRRWHPRVIVVTGSSGKTTLLHFLESQIGSCAKYSHHANSSFGIPFDILGLHRKSLQRSEWVSLFLKAPFLAFTHFPKEKIYVVEADVDRPGEGKFLATLLHPEVALWVSVGRTHSMNFDPLVSSGKFKTVDEAIAYEYGYFLKYCTKQVFINGDSELQLKQANRTEAKITAIKQKAIEHFALSKNGTTFGIAGKKIVFPYLFPEEVGISLLMCSETVDYLGLPFDYDFKSFIMPPGRGSVFVGIRKTTIIDSSYNANLGSIKAMLSMLAQISEKKKWVVLGDMLELGKEEKEEHEQLAEVLEKMHVEKIILVGKLVSKYTYPKIVKNKNVFVEKFIQQKEARDYLLSHLNGGEIILFKGSQSLLLEGIIERLLENKKDASKLPRREEIWEERREKILS